LLFFYSTAIGNDGGFFIFNFLSHNRTLKCGVTEKKIGSPMENRLFAPVFRRLLVNVNDMLKGKKDFVVPKKCFTFVLNKK